MIRKHAVLALAALAFGLVVAAPAEAGGSSGAAGVKKNATVNINNTTQSPYYVVVVPGSLATSKQFGTIGTLGWANKLGGVLVNPGRTVSYPVPAGPGEIAIYVPAQLPKTAAEPLPGSAATGAYTVGNGGVITKTIAAGPTIK